jgi:hypothetical protein
MALVFLGLGSVMLFGRRWLTLDLGRGSVIRRQGLLIPMRTEVRRLSEFTAVAVGFDPGDSDSPERYPVHLRAASAKDFVISTPAQFSEARKQAEYLSRFLRLPLADRTTDHETVVSPEHAFDSLRDRLLRSAAETERPIPPPGMLSKVTESSGEAIVVIPGARFPLSGVFGVLVPVVILLGVIPAIMRVLSRNLGSAGVSVAFLIVLLLIFGIPAIIVSAKLTLDSMRRRTTVKASPAGLVIEQRSAGRTRIKVLSASDILDIDQSTVGGALESKRNSLRMTPSGGATGKGLLTTLREWVPGQGIVVKSRQEVITIGQALPASELEYLRWVLRKSLAGG